MANKPKVFISSTIYDFRDLRSALKYYLESFGYEVLLSEYNDFKKDLNANSFEACLKTIEEVQFFILLVGGRVGGYYGKDNKTSITQMEYRKAYEELKKGKLKIVNIVRENLWDAKNERKSLEKLIRTEYKDKYNISFDDVAKIKNYESDIVRDAEFIFNFIDEIARVSEMKVAQKDSRDFPVGNWVHPFKTFRDIVDILKREFSFSDDLESIAMKENIKYELFENINILFDKTENGTICPINKTANEIFRIYNGELKEYTTFTEDQLKPFQTYLVDGIWMSQNLKTDYIDHALKSGKYLSFDNQTGKFTQTPFSNSLQNLKSFVEHLKSLISMKEINHENIFKIINDINNNKNYTISNIILYSIGSIFKLQNQIIKLSLFMYSDILNSSTLLDNFDYEGNPLNKEISEHLKEERITESDLLKYLNDILEKA